MKYLLPLFASFCAIAQPADPWKPVQFLTGEWIGDTPGTCSFTFDLGHKVMIRNSYAESAGSRHVVTPSNRARIWSGFSVTDVA